MTFVGLKTAEIHLLDPDPYSKSGSRRRFESGSATLQFSSYIFKNCILVHRYEKALENFYFKKTLQL